MRPLGQKALIEKELEGFGIRLNKVPPKIRFKRKERGGVNLQVTAHPQAHLDLETCKSICSEYKISCADVTLSEPNLTVDQLIDEIEGNRQYVPCIYVLNKIDQITIEELDLVYKVPNAVPISAHHKWNFDDLLETMWIKLNLLRIYTKPKGQLPDYTSPVILSQKKKTVENFCNKIHKHLMEDFKHALVWGTSVKHNPQ